MCADSGMPQIYYLAPTVTDAVNAFCLLYVFSHKVREAPSGTTNTDLYQEFCYLSQFITQISTIRCV